MNETAISRQPVEGSVEYWAQLKPGATAIIDGDIALTWGDWNEKADRLAHALLRRGVGPDDIVIARMTTRHEWPILRAALSKIGCRMLVLNWRLTPVETEHVIADSGASVVILDDADPVQLAPAWARLPVRLTISIDADAPGFENWADLIAEPPGQPLIAAADASLVVYTSGTTGLPKGVVLHQVKPGQEREHAEYRASVSAARGQVQGDIALVTMPMHHGAGPSIVGLSTRFGNLMIFERRFDAERTLGLIEKHRITFWSAVPTMYKRIAGLPEAVRAQYDISSIRALTIGAAPSTPELKDWIVETFGDCLAEGYGATETSMIAALAPEMRKAKRGSSGKPYAHVVVEVRGASGEALPEGATGELWVRTPVTITNYLNKPPLGADELDARGFFRTGDIGHVDADGYLFITDRAKDMIVSGGVNIYPAEIEAALLRHPDIQDAAVVGAPHEDFGEQVIAYCEPKPGAALSPEQIAAHCAGQLASYKQPRRIEIIEELPRNTMGKILKRVLRDQHWADRERKV